MRRLVSTTIVLMALLLATVAAAPGVSAQDTAEHPAVGAWIIDSSPEDPTDPLELLTVAPGGIITNAGPDGTGYGSWAATGDRTRGRDLPVPDQRPGGRASSASSRSAPASRWPRTVRASPGPIRSSSRPPWPRPWAHPWASSVRAR